MSSTGGPLGAVGGLLPAGRGPRALLAVVLAASIGNGATLPFLYVYLSRVRHLDPTEAGLVGGWLGLAGLLLAVPAGALVDRLGARRVFVPMCLLRAAGLGGTAFVHTTWQAFGAATLLSLGGAPLFGAYNTLLASAADPRQQQRFFGLAFATLNLGQGIGGLIGGAVTHLARPATFAGLYLGNAAVLVLTAFPVLLLRGLGAPSRRAADAPGPAAGYRVVLRDAVFRRFLVLATLLVGCTWAQLEFGFTAFAADVADVSARVIGWAFAANALTVVVVQVVAVRRIEGRRRTGVLVATAVVIAACWLVLGAGAALRDVAPAFAVAGVLGCAVIHAGGEVLMSPVLPALTNDLAPDALRGRYNAVFSMVLGSASVVGPVTSAPLIGHGLAGVWLVLVVGGSLGVAVLARRLGPLLTDAQNGRGRPQGDPLHAAVAQPPLG